MPHLSDGLLILGLLLVAALYASVGHAGSSGYQALFALASLPQDQARFSALVLNVAVATLGVYHFARARTIDPRLLVPLLLGSVPLAFLGGSWKLPASSYSLLLAAVLLFAAVRLVIIRPGDVDYQPRPPRAPGLFLTGALIGLLSGLTATGGGIFLTPWLIFTRWATPRSAAGLSVAFILANSLAGLAGQATTRPAWPAALPLFIIAVLLGGWVGARYGARRLDDTRLKRLLAAVLLLASLKLLLPSLTGWRGRSDAVGSPRSPDAAPLTPPSSPHTASSAPKTPAPRPSSPPWS